MMFQGEFRAFIHHFYVSNMYKLETTKKKPHNLSLSL